MRYLETVLNILQATPQWKEAMQSMTQEEMRVSVAILLVSSLFNDYLLVRTNDWSRSLG